MKKNYEFIKKTAQFKALAAFSMLALLGFSGCNKEIDDEGLGTGAANYKLEKPTACPIAGEVAPNTHIRLYNAMDADASIYYTMDGRSDPTADTPERTLYSDGAKPVITGEDGAVITIKAYSVKEGMADSVVAAFAYTVNSNMAATPTASPPGGEVALGAEITLSTATEGASIYYTTNGGDPTTGSTLYSASNKPTITVTPTTIKAIAVKDGKKNSAAAEFEYTLNYLTFSFVTSAENNTPVDGSVTPRYTTGDSNIEYSIDGGATWNTIASGGTTDSAQKILFRGSGRTSLYDSPDLSLVVANTSNNNWTVATSGKTRVSGNANTVLDYTNPPASVTTACFSGMFAFCNSLIEAPTLPANSAGQYAYAGMFFDCPLLKNAPDLPAQTIDEYCYYGMFYSCDGLENAPAALPAATAKNMCYSKMFADCDSLKEAPALPAITIEDYCYYYMFYNCAELEDPPATLPAAILGQHCYNGMFRECPSLTSAPAILAKSFAYQSCSEMFEDCTSLKNVPDFVADSFGYQSCYKMFQNCVSLETAPALHAATMADSCCQYMFFHCDSLENVPALPNAVLALGCYNGMFEYCGALVNAPALPSTALANDCYISMFAWCDSLTASPYLPAETLVARCYMSMFYECTSLTEIRCNAANIDAGNCVGNWTNGVSDSGNFYKNPAINVGQNVGEWPTGDSGIPTGWTVHDIQP